MSLKNLVSAADYFEMFGNINFDLIFFLPLVTQMDRVEIIKQTNTILKNNV